MNIWKEGEWNVSGISGDTDALTEGFLYSTVAKNLKGDGRKIIDLKPRLCQTSSGRIGLCFEKKPIGSGH